MFPAVVGTQVPLLGGVLAVRSNQYVTPVRPTLVCVVALQLALWTSLLCLVLLDFMLCFIFIHMLVILLSVHVGRR